jgi:hypothetical protein
MEVRFNHEYYAELNPDLEWLGIYKPQDLMNHWRSNAAREGRKWRFSDMYPEFDPDIYRSLYMDVKGKTDQECEYHYFSIGRHEDRQATIRDVYPDFTWELYKKNNPDLERDLNIISQREYEKHWVRIGRYANRTYLAPSLVDPPIQKKRIGCFLVGFGHPNLDIKIQILKHNLEVLKKNLSDYSIDLYIYMYSTDEKDKAVFGGISFLQHVTNAFIKVERGIVGEFIYKYVVKQVKQYDYTVLFLDDIKLPNDFRFKNMAKVYELEQLDVLALPLTVQSPHMHPFSLQNMQMKQTGFNYRETNFAELFFYFMNTNGFKKYYSMLDINSKWCWGIDLGMSGEGIRMGLLEHYPIQHFFKSKSYSPNLPNPVAEQQYNSKRFRFISNQQIWKVDKFVM